LDSSKYNREIVHSAKMSNESEKIPVEGMGRGQSTAASLSDESLTNPTGINEKALLWKLDLRLLPPLTLLYLLSFLDRSNSKLLVSVVSHNDPC
jgi:hypothetical protein